MGNEFVSTQSNAIPPNFGKDNSTVLVCVLKGHKSYDNTLTKALTEHYNGKYDFIDEGQDYDLLYGDKDKYRYLLDRSRVKIYGPQIDSDGQYVHTFFIYDRVEDKNYALDATSLSFMAVLEAYIIKLENARSANAK